MPDETQKEDGRFVVRIGPVDIDWPRTIGFYGGLAAAVAFDLVAPPLAAFVAVVPLLKLLKRKHATMPERFAAAVLEGASKPVGGDADATVRPAWLDEERDEEAEQAKNEKKTAHDGGAQRTAAE